MTFPHLDGSFRFQNFWVYIKQPVALNWRNSGIDMFRLKCKETDKAGESFHVN